MDMFLWIGSAVGAVIGVLHGFSLYQKMAARAATSGTRAGIGAGTGGSPGRALYYGLWTFVLWTVFGSYVLAFWLIGGVAQSLAGLKR
ncbi:MAG: hypothetical protein HQ511_05260 [Rhodospirillales bacterium]|nr:hypothetical protein [Rhodospirillales bacterium]